MKIANYIQVMQRRGKTVCGLKTLRSPRVEMYVRVREREQHLGPSWKPHTNVQYHCKISEGETRVSGGERDLERDLG